MTKREIAIKVAAQMKANKKQTTKKVKAKLTQNQVGEVIQRTLDCLCEAIKEGETIELRNFGVFEVKVRKSRIGRNPKQNPTQDIVIPERCVVKFRPGCHLKQIVGHIDTKTI